MEASKLTRVVDTNEELMGYAFHCPGCGHGHLYYTEYKNKVGAIWSFNGDIDNPTFSPSLKNTYPDGRVCHLYVRDGKIQYLNDCFHKLKGQTIEMVKEWV